MTGKEDQYRGSAIRALCVITDVRTIVDDFHIIYFIALSLSSEYHGTSYRALYEASYC